MASWGPIQTHALWVAGVDCLRCGERVHVGEEHTSTDARAALRTMMREHAQECPGI